MFKHLLLAASLLPMAAHAESTQIVLTTERPGISIALLAPNKATTPAPPGLTFRLPLPRPAPQKPILVLPPALKDRVKALSAVASEPTVPKPPVRLLVFRDDDRKATKTVHPLLTPDIRVEVLPAKPPKPNP